MENKELKNLELTDEQLDQASGGSGSNCYCRCCQRVMTPVEINLHMGTICISCQLEQLRQQNPNLTNEELIILWQTINNISVTDTHNTETLQSLSKGAD